MAEYNHLLDTTDAQQWAQAFVELHGGDEGLMLAWFASAIETGRSAGESTYRAENDRLRRFAEQCAEESFASLLRVDELQALIDAFVTVDQNPDDTGWDDAYNALLAAAAKGSNRG